MTDQYEKYSLISQLLMYEQNGVELQATYTVDDDLEVLQSEVNRIKQMNQQAQEQQIIRQLQQAFEQIQTQTTKTMSEYEFNVGVLEKVRHIKELCPHATTIQEYIRAMPNINLDQFCQDEPSTNTTNTPDAIDETEKPELTEDDKLIFAAALFCKATLSSFM